MQQVLHTIASLHPNYGGPSRTVSNLCQALANYTSVQPCLISQKKKNEPIVEINTSSFDLQIAESNFRVALRMYWPLKGLLHKVLRVRRPDILHDHGIWLPSNHYVANAARRFRIPLVIHTRGMLEPWALQYRSKKKQLALILYQQRDLALARLFFATSEQELACLRRQGLKQPVAIIPNGVIRQQAFSHESTIERKNSPRNVCFLGRIHPIKGLLNLIKAWAQLPPPSNWRLRLAGPDEGGHLAEIMQCVHKYKLEKSVEYLGVVEGQEKSKLLSTADLFVLPSYSENFGLVVAEALSYGVPVITTHGTPWQELVTHGCGWWVKPDVGSFVITLREAMGLDDTTLCEMGERARGYAREFDWQNIAQRTAEVYRWVTGDGPLPDCVVTD